jgi:hypothetical protein
MSLVNDALRRAQDAQKNAQPPAPGPALRPAEPAAPPKQGVGLAMPVIIAVVVVAGLVLIWKNRQKTEARQPMVEPKPATPAVAAQETKPPVEPVTAPAPAPPAPVAVVAEKPAPTPVVSAPAPPLKLQAIFYAPGHSSAIISGKTVHAGDNFKGFRVAAITQTSATLISATQTNVMTLETE